MEALKMIPYIVLMLAVAGLIAGATSLSLGKFGDSLTKCEGVGPNSEAPLWNTSLGACANTSGLSGGTIAVTDEWNVTLSGQEGLMAVAEQFPTIGVIAVMVIIISLIAGVFVYFKYFG